MEKVIVHDDNPMQSENSGVIWIRDYGPQISILKWPSFNTFYTAVVPMEILNNRELQNLDIVIFIVFASLKG